LPLGRGRNCLGKLGVLSGHNLVPLPPAKMTAFRCFISQIPQSLFMIMMQGLYKALAPMSNGGLLS
jgi:hypothetical protein